MTAETTPANPSTIADLTKAKATHLIAGQLGGDPHHGDVATGFYVDDIEMHGESLTITVSDEGGQRTHCNITVSSPTVAKGQPAYLDPYPFIEPATRT